MPLRTPAPPPPSVLITRDMLTLHTRGLAARAGRKPPQVTQQDYEQARLELTGEHDPERQEALIHP